MRVCIVGGGASGMAAAWSLSRFPDEYQVDLFEKEDQLGGVATSETVTLNNGEKVFINDGVQGGSSSYRNTMMLLKELGMDVTPVHMKISFGKNETAWNNHGKEQETELIRRMRGEIRRFGTVLQIISALEFLFIFLPIWLVMKIFFFSKDFSNLMVYPLTALFFGTGNQTPYVSAAVVARVFLDPNLRLFDYDNELFLSQSPDMFAFPKLREVYERMKQVCEERGCVQFFTGHPIKSVQRIYNSREGTYKVEVRDFNDQVHQYDKIIFSCNAETVLKILKEPSRMERFTLGNVVYYDDVTVTHQDEEYMRENYEIDEQRKDQYFIRIDPTDPTKLDMSFNLSNYQPQLTTSNNQRKPIYQTIFLDEKSRKDQWTLDKINKGTILLTKYWRQFSHSWKHFLSVVPFVSFLQGRRSTYYCGSYLLMNTHEIAIISGLAAAHQLGAKYPFSDSEDSLAHMQFKTFLKIAYKQF